MIFATVGSAPHDFSRIVKEMDNIFLEVGEEIVVQKGFTKFIPSRVKYFDFVTYEQAISYYRDAKVIISHVSAGPVIYARKFNKPLVLMPRRGDLNEHIDNHQVETAKAIEGLSEMVEVVYNEGLLIEAVRRALNKIIEKKNYAPLTSLDELIMCISDYVRKSEKADKRL